MENYDKNITLAYKYLTDELIDEEKDIFNERLKTDSDFRTLFNDIKKIWDFSENNIDERILSINIDKEWEKQKQKISQTKNNVVKLNKKRSRAIPLAIAAMLVLFVGLFFLFKNSTQTINTGNEIITAQLPDNSEVVINRNSVIEYPRNFDKQRIVKLDGSAYFKVEHDSLRPFVVVAGDYNVQVVGTEFYVNSDSVNFEVDVVKGIVKVYKNGQEQQAVLISAGEKVSFDEQTSTGLKKSDIQDNNFIAWQTNKIVINNLTLKQISKILSTTYGVDIQISNPELENQRMTATFENQTLESVIKVVEATLNVKIIKQGDKYIIIE